MRAGGFAPVFIVTLRMTDPGVPVGAELARSKASCSPGPSQLGPSKGKWGGEENPHNGMMIRTSKPPPAALASSKRHRSP